MANWAIEKMEKRINSTVAAMFSFALDLIAIAMFSLDQSAIAGVCSDAV